MALVGRDIGRVGLQQISQGRELKKTQLSLPLGSPEQEKTLGEIQFTLLPSGRRLEIVSLSKKGFFPGKGHTRNSLSDQFQYSVSLIVKKFLGRPGTSPAVIQACFLFLGSFL